MMALERVVVFADTRNDITNDVVYNLNLAYKAAGGKAPKTTTSTHDPSAAPTGAGATAGPGGN